MMYRRGRTSQGQTGDYFKAGFIEFVNTLDAKFDPMLGESEDVKTRLAELLYTNARNGLFHDVMTRKHIALFREGDAALWFQRFQNPTDNSEYERVLINVEILMKALVIYFQDYMAKIRNPENEELRTNFESAWDELHKSTNE